MANSGRRLSTDSQVGRLQRLLGVKERRRVFKRRLMMESLETRRVLANFEVTSLLDTTDASDGVITLREAIASANTAAGADTISFAQGLSGAITLTQGELPITDSLQIVGPGAGLLAIDANQQSRVIAVQSDRSLTVSLEGLTIRGGKTTANNENGAGIRFNSPGGQLGLVDSVVSGNLTEGIAAQGGGIYASRGDVVLTRSTVQENQTSNGSSSGGGISTAYANVSLIDSKVLNNRTLGLSAFGGGVFTVLGAVTLSGGTVSGNSTAGDRAHGGGIITSSGAVTLTSSTVSGNSTAGTYASGGGISTSSGAVTLTGSTVSANRTEGSGATGGGISTLSGAVTLTGSTISGNSTAGISAYGGGISTLSGPVTLTGSTVSGNSTERSGATGGGINTSSGAVTLTGSTVSGNRTTGQSAFGGGISTSSGAVTLTGSTVSGNSTAAQVAAGGGIRTSSGAVTLTDSTISGNSTAGISAYGGGILTASGAVTLTGSTVSGNSTTGYRAHGGGIAADASAVTLTGSTVSGNQVTGTVSDGGGLWSNGSLVTIVNSTITANSAARAGGGLGFFVNSTNNKLTIHNSIIAGNTAGSDPDVTAPSPLATSLEVRSSLIGDNTGTTLTAAATADANGNLVGTSSSLLNPGLSTLGFNGGTTQTHALLADSPALNAGDNSLVASQANDQRGAPFARIANDAVDMGAYERQTLAPSFFVVTTLDDEFDFSNTDVSLREAIYSANGSIGTDTITFANALVSSGPAKITLTRGELLITESVNIVGAAVTSPAKPGETLLTIDADQLSRVINVQGSTLNMVDLSISGLTLTGGEAKTDVGGGILFDSPGKLNLTDSTVSNSKTLADDGYGGGIYTSAGEITLLRSRVTGNSTAGFFAVGGGIHTFSGKLMVTDSLVSENFTRGKYASGGGIVAGIAEVVLNNTVVDANFTTGEQTIGGGIASFDGLLTIENKSSIRNNYHTGFGSAGGGIGKFTGDVSLTNSELVGNFIQGESGQGGGIYTASGAIMLTRSDLSNNQTEAANSPGGGISTNSGNVNLVQSTIRNNETLKDSSFGGGINVFSGNVTVDRSTVSGNRTDGIASAGAGILTNTGNITVDRSLITNNSTRNNRSPGGGIQTSFGNITLTSTTVSGNRTAGSESPGGGINSSAGKVSLTSSTIAGNSTSGALSPGGGVRSFSGDIALENSTVSGNSTAGANAEGGGLSSFRGDVSLLNSTVAFNNTAGTSSAGGGVFANFDAAMEVNDGERGSLTIQNSIIAQNTVGTGVLGPDLYASNFAPINPTALMVVQSSLIGTNADTTLVAAPVGAPDAQGNLIGTAAASIDPKLMPLASNGGSTQTHALLADSPALNAGSNALIASQTSDQRGAPFVRIADNTVDMGAYERQVLVLPSPLVVTTLDDELDAVTLDDLSDLSLREALGLANGSIGPDTITFAADLFNGGSSSMVLSLGELQITDSVAITGPGQTLLAIDANQQSRVLNVIGGGNPINVTLEGLTLTRGKTTGDNTSNENVHSGGGIRFDSSGTLTLTGSTVSGNSTAGSFARGGGIYTNLGVVTLTGSTVSGNSTAGDRAFGGGIYARSGAVTLTSSTVSGNSTAGTNSDGGGIYTNSGAVTLSSSTLSGNKTEGPGAHGGGIYTRSGAVTLTGSTVSGNRVTGSNSDGGGVMFLSNEFNIFNSTITANSAARASGGLGRPNGIVSIKKLTIHNSIIAGNTAASNPDFTAPSNPGDLEVRSSLIGINQGTTLTASATADAQGNLVGALNAIIAPRLGPLQNNGGPTQTHALLPGSPALDAGNANLLPGGLNTDQRGSTRVLDLRDISNATGGDGLDMGAVEMLGVSIGDATANENAGTLDFVVTLSHPVPAGFTVTLLLDTQEVNGDAKAGSDFTALVNQSLTFNSGDPLTKTVSVPILGDTLDEANETLQLKLTSAIGAVITKDTGVGTITDDDEAPTLSIGDATVVEGNVGTANAMFTVMLSAASGQAVTVNYATADGTAIQPDDYTSSNGTLTFAPGETTKTITVAVKGDTLDELNESFNVNLATPVNATITDNLGVGTITNDDTSPTLSINDVTVAEGNSGTVSATFTVTLSAASSQQVTVNYETANGTATQPDDYASSNGTLTFAPGETTKTITVAVKGDTLDEINEVFSVALASPTNATIANGTGVGTITDDDASPTLSINDVTVTEGNTGTVNAMFTVTLSAASSQQVTVNFETSNGTATQPADYTPSTGVLTFAPGETTKTITVAVKGDTLDEINEVFNVTLASPTNATIANGTGVGTITDDDASPTLSINDVTVTEGNTGTVNAMFTVSLSAPSSQQVTVNYETANGTAVQPGDYTPSNGTLTFAPGETTKTITVAVKGDTLDEINEVFNVTLASPTNATIADGTGVGTITDDDASPTLSINDVTVTEGNAGTANATFTVTLSAASGQAVTVNYETANGTATQPDDYASSNGTLTFAPGETTKTITVAVKGDTLDEINEVFNVALASPTNATIADGTGVGTITDNDASPTLSISDVTVTEGNTGTVNATFTVTLSAASGQAVTVNYETANGTATQPADYTPSNGTLTFAPGETSKTITVAVKGDTLDELNETFNVNLAT